MRGAGATRHDDRSGTRGGAGPGGEARISVDASAWPLVVLRWPAGVRGDAEVDGALARLEAIAARREAHGLLVDARDARTPTPAQLGRILEVARRTGPSSRCVAHAIVARSAGVRAIVDSIRWMTLTRARWAHFDELGPAEAWVGQTLARERAMETLAAPSRGARAYDPRPARRATLPPPS